MSDTARVWPSRLPRFALARFALACLGGVGLFRLWQARERSPAFYLAQYLTTSAYSGREAKAFRVILPGGQVGSVTLLPAGFNRWVAREIFHNQPLTTVLQWPLGGFALLLLVGLVGGGIIDARHNRKAEHGRLLRGPKLVSGRRFNRLTRGDGLRFQVGPQRSIRIRRNREAHHIQIAGDTGAGKSTVGRDILYQVEERDEVAIVFDPDREYIREFYDEGRGD